MLSVWTGDDMVSPAHGVNKREMVGNKVKKGGRGQIMKDTEGEGKEFGFHGRDRQGKNYFCHTFKVQEIELKLIYPVP